MGVCVWVGGDLCQTKERMFRKEFTDHPDQYMDKEVFTATLSEMTFRFKLYGDFAPPRKTGEGTRVLANPSK